MRMLQSSKLIDCATETEDDGPEPIGTFGVWVGTRVVADVARARRAPPSGGSVDKAEEVVNALAGKMFEAEPAVPPLPLWAGPQCPRSRPHDEIRRAAGPLGERQARKLAQSAAPASFSLPRWRRVSVRSRLSSLLRERNNFFSVDAELELKVATAA